MDLHLPTPAGELTRAEQKILDYINTNTDAFLFSSIGQLAQQLELSDATVSRFARHVGCRDFKALKSLVLEQSPGPAVKLTATLSQGDHFSPQAWLERQRAYLEKTIQQLSTGEFDRAVEALCSAQRVFVHGKNASASLAQLLHFRLPGIQLALLRFQTLQLPLLFLPLPQLVQPHSCILPLFIQQLLPGHEFLQRLLVAFVLLLQFPAQAVFSGSSSRRAALRHL